MAGVRDRVGAWLRLGAELSRRAALRARGYQVPNEVPDSAKVTPYNPTLPHLIWRFEPKNTCK